MYFKVVIIMEKALVPGISLCDEERRKRWVGKKFRLHIAPHIQDLSMTRSIIYTISCLGNAFLTENYTWRRHAIYFGSTGYSEDFYLITRHLSDESVVNLVEQICGFIVNANESDLAEDDECGIDLAGAKFVMARYHIALATGRQQKASN